jgi:hypothetical protein
MDSKVLLLCTILLVGASAQTETLDSVDILPSTDRGYVRVTYTTTLGGSQTGPVCGQIEIISAVFVCQINGWIASTGQGTTGEFGISATGPPIGSNLTCIGATASQCSVSTAASCLPTEYAAITCYFTVGQIVGIAIGAFILCLLISVLPFVICCIICCCCGVCVAAAT